MIGEYILSSLLKDGKEPPVYFWHFDRYEKGLFVKMAVLKRDPDDGSLVLEYMVKEETLQVYYSEVKERTFLSEVECTLSAIAWAEDTLEYLEEHPEEDVDLEEQKNITLGLYKLNYLLSGYKHAL